MEGALVPLCQLSNIYYRNAKHTDEPNYSKSLLTKAKSKNVSLTTNHLPYGKKITAQKASRNENTACEYDFRQNRLIQ